MDLSAAGSSRSSLSSRKLSNQSFLALNQLYSINPYPDFYQLRNLARINNLDLARVKNWFQYRRDRDFRQGNLCRQCRYFKSHIFSESIHLSDPYSRPCFLASQFIQLVSASANIPPPIHRPALQPVTQIGNNFTHTHNNFTQQLHGIPCNFPNPQSYYPQQQQSNQKQSVAIPQLIHYQQKENRSHGFYEGNGCIQQEMSTEVHQSHYNPINNANLGWMNHPPQLPAFANSFFPVFQNGMVQQPLPSTHQPFQERVDDNYSQIIKCDPYQWISDDETDVQ